VQVTAQFTDDVSKRKYKKFGHIEVLNLPRYDAVSIGNFRRFKENLYNHLEV